MRANGRTNHGAILGALFLLTGAGAALALPACGGSQAPAQGQDALDADPPAGHVAQGGPTHAELKQGIDAIKAERYDEAKPLLEKAVEQSPKSSEAHFYLAVARERTGDRAGAEDAYKKSLAIDPNGMEAMTNLSALYLDDPACP